TRLEHLRRRCEQHLQVLQLSVYEDSDCLESSRRRMYALRFHWPERGRYNLREMSGCSYRPRPDNGSGDSPRPPFLTEFVNHIGELFFAHAVYHLIGGALAMLIHAHVERPFRLKAESARRFRELQRTQTKIGQNSVGQDRRNSRANFGE